MVLSAGKLLLSRLLPICFHCFEQVLVFEKIFFVDNELTLTQSTQRLYTGVKLLLLNTWSVVISYAKKSFISTLRKFLTFSVFHFDLKIVVIFCLDFDFMVVEENVCFSFFFISDVG